MMTQSAYVRIRYYYPRMKDQTYCHLRTKTYKNKRPKVFLSHQMSSSLNEHYLDHMCERSIRIKKQESRCSSE